MNFATLNKKWFHEVNISVTIPSPTRDAHARTHARTDARTHSCTHARMHAAYDTTTRRIGRTCIYIHLRTHIDRRPHVHSLILACSTLSLFRAQGHSSAYITGATHARTQPYVHTRTRGCKRAAHSRVKNEGSERGIGRTARREGERKRALRADRKRKRGGTQKERERGATRARERARGHSARTHAHRARTHTTGLPKKLHGRGAATGKPNRARIKCFGQSRSQSLYD